MSTRRRALAFVPASLLLVAGCAVFRAQHSAEMWGRKLSPPTPPPATSTPTPDAVPGSSDAAPSFARVQNEILTPRCAIPDCHAARGAGEGLAPEGLILAADRSYELLVGVPSGQRPDLLRIAPGNPDDSYLIRKVTAGAQIEWSRMPLEGPKLDAEEIALLRAWVAAGAPR